MEVIWGYPRSQKLREKLQSDDGLFPSVYLNEYLCAECFSGKVKSFRNCITWMLELLIVRIVVGKGRWKG
jgi:hypothetical protein